MILRDEYAAQDAVQDACIEAWRSLPGLRDPDRSTRGSGDSSCARASRRPAHQARRRGRDPLTPVDEPAIAGGERDLDLRDQLERGLARLSAEQRAVVVLVYYLDLPLADAAQAMGIPVGTTKSRLNRARKALRAAIEADDREPSRLGGANRMTNDRFSGQLRQHLLDTANERLAEGQLAAVIDRVAVTSQRPTLVARLSSFPGRVAPLPKSQLRWAVAVALALIGATIAGAILVGGPALRGTGFEEARGPR